MCAFVFTVPAAREIQKEYYHQPYNINTQKIKPEVIGLKIVSSVRVHYLTIVKP